MDAIFVFVMLFFTSEKSDFFNVFLKLVNHVLQHLFVHCFDIKIYTFIHNKSISILKTLKFELVKDNCTIFVVTVASWLLFNWTFMRAS